MLFFLYYFELHAHGLMEQDLRMFQCLFGLIWSEVRFDIVVLVLTLLKFNCSVITCSMVYQCLLSRIVLLKLLNMQWNISALLQIIKENCFSQRSCYVRYGTREFKWEILAGRSIWVSRVWHSRYVSFGVHCKNLGL